MKNISYYPFMIAIIIRLEYDCFVESSATAVSNRPYLYPKIVLTKIIILFHYAYLKML